MSEDPTLAPEQSSTQTDALTPEKEPYEPPELIEEGTVANLTAISAGINTDGDLSQS
jgi:hypothetical protein